MQKKVKPGVQNLHKPAQLRDEVISDGPIRPERDRVRVQGPVPEDLVPEGPVLDGPVPEGPRRADLPIRGHVPRSVVD